MKRFFVLLSMALSFGLFSSVGQASIASETPSISAVSPPPVMQYHHGVGG
ncbi:MULTISPECIES: hypothetical protein [Brevibacillus]|nr:hypothetical protein [Brevibacillus porteri]MED1802447.1 hypothetical protein [Brevibacillus porteri]MED2129629.1 hypothetical protein [Brevibacillus porteri]MED2747463.1 hypothetical protein [Brevibacillus porteri]MED2816970.1 hypothetical protein [Brevibacillus porteri]MED2894954.1 hypothetical protein [Brevibacillus porteri]